MAENTCKIYEHIFSTNLIDKLVCEKCNKTYADYLSDVQLHKNTYRFKNKSSS
jgi:hypothetical protein